MLAGAAAFGVLLAAQPTVPAGAPPDGAYGDVVRRYASGERIAAVVEIGRWTRAALARALDRLRSTAPRASACLQCPGPELVPLRAAVMLHTDRDDLERERPVPLGEQAPTCGRGAHARFAERLVRLLLEDESSRDFARRWYLAMTLRSLGVPCLDDAGEWARAGLRWFPADAELLLAAGKVKETTAELAPEPPPIRMPVAEEREAVRGQMRERRLRWEEAREAFERAAAAGIVEAWLRLGRVSFRLGQHEAARSALRTVVEKGDSAHLVYLAHLFQGRVEEEEGRLEAAEQEYRASLDLDPSAQSAAAGLSHLLDTRDDAAAALDVLEAGLSWAGRRSGPDLYWVYMAGGAQAAPALLDELRREATR